MALAVHTARRGWATPADVLNTLPLRRSSTVGDTPRRAAGRYGGAVAGSDAQVLDLAGREVRITSPDKVLFSERGETKLDLVRYYAAVEEPLMRAMGGRPVLMQRFPKGAGGPSFFQKRVPDGAPEWLQTTTVQTVNGTPSRALVAADVAHVAWAVNLACLGFHVWPNRADDDEHADELRLDLDPQPGTGFAEAREAARELKALLDELGHRRLSQDDRQPRAARLRPAGAAVGLLRRALRRGGRGARARAPAARHPHRRLVEGGARAAGSSSTTTRTRRTRRSSAPGRSAPARARRSRRRSAGRSSTTSSPTS